MSEHTPELKSCPFCGGPAEMVPWHGGGPDKQLICCESETCEVGPSVTGETPKEAIALWNGRVDDEATALLGEARTLLDSFMSHDAFWQPLTKESEDDADWNEQRREDFYTEVKDFIDRTTP